MRSTINQNNIILIYVLFIMMPVLILSCESEPEECTRIDTIGGGLIPERQVEVPCDLPEPEPFN